MYIIGLVVAAAILAVIVKLCRTYQNKIKFFLTGIDSKFTFSEIGLLWKTAQFCSLEQPLSLYWSLPALTHCISLIKSRTEKNGLLSASHQRLLTKLYTYRTKLEKEADKKKGIESTRVLDSGQRLRIILPGKGVFFSRIVNNARELTISIPTQKGLIPVEGKDWIGKTVSIYLWRKGDARYVFDTTVLGEGLFLGKPSLYLRHTDKLLRTQKRNSVRMKCKIYASLFIIKEKVINYSAVETKPGYRCLIEDISESGAMVRIGGKGVPNIQMKLQFTLDDKLIIMYGIVRMIEYNETINQSRLHFECIHIEPQMKNEVLSFVYNIMPEQEKEIFDAISLTNEDETESGDGAAGSGTAESADTAGSSDTADSAEHAEQDGKQPENFPDGEFLPDLPQETVLFPESPGPGSQGSFSDGTLKTVSKEATKEA